MCEIFGQVSTHWLFLKQSMRDKILKFGKEKIMKLTKWNVFLQLFSATRKWSLLCPSWLLHLLSCVQSIHQKLRQLFAMALPIAMPQLLTVLVPAKHSVSLLDVMLPLCVHSHLTVLIHFLELNALVLNWNQVANNI